MLEMIYTEQIITNVYTNVNLGVNKKKLILVFIKDALNWSKVTVNTFITLQKISVSNECWTFYSSVSRGSWEWIWKDLSASDGGFWAGWDL